MGLGANALARLTPAAGPTITPPKTISRERHGQIIFFSRSFRDSLDSAYIRAQWALMASAATRPDGSPAIRRAIQHVRAVKSSTYDRSTLGLGLSVWPPCGYALFS